MEKQPAYTNYFFKGGYVELGRTISNGFYRCKRDIIDAWWLLGEAFEDLAQLKHIWYAFLWCITFGQSVTAELEFEWKGFFYSFWALIKFCFALFKLVCVAVVTSIVTIAFSSVHVVILMIFFLVAYIFFGVVMLSDKIFCMIKKIGNSCPQCQKKFELPTYVCLCGNKHTKLVPSKYGIFKRKCNCKRKLNTTFFNGRAKLPGRWVCPSCGYDMGEDIMHTDIPILVVGGPSSGKTCYISMAISELEKNAPANNLVFEYHENKALGDDYLYNKETMEKGYLPEKTQELRLRYYQFYLTPKDVEIRNLISLCDVAGETYERNDEMAKQIGYKHAEAFLIIIDPLSLAAYRSELEEEIPDLAKNYKPSNRAMDEVVDTLMNTLKDMGNSGSKELVQAEVAVVFTKCDIPGLDEKIGAKAVEEYMSNSDVKNPYEAKNKVCEQFLMEYEGDNFLNILRSKFRSIQFFTSTALGHVENGEEFVPSGVEEPVLWLVDKVSATMNLKEKWGKEI